jgi:hypothetical protein
MSAKYGITFYETPTTPKENTMDFLLKEASFSGHIERYGTTCIGRSGTEKSATTKIR